MRTIGTFASLGLLAACATTGDPRSDDWARKPAVIAQFCVAEGNIPGEPKLPGYLHFMNIKEGGSDGGITRHVGTTESGQLVFESFLGRIGEHQAVIVFGLTETQQVFFARRSYQPNQWTAWLAPDQVSADKNLWYKLVYGQRYVKGSPSPISAYARFKQGSYVEFADELRRRRLADLDSKLPSCPPVPINSSLQSGPATSGPPPELSR